jgi:hypothetical protein
MQPGVSSFINEKNFAWCFSVRGSSAFFFWDVRRQPGSGTSGRHGPRPRSRPIWHGRLALEHPRQEQMSRQHRSVIHGVGESCLFCCPSREQQTRNPSKSFNAKADTAPFLEINSYNFELPRNANGILVARTSCL